MQSSELKSRAQAYGRMAQKVPSLAAKQRLLAQQQKCMALARAAEKQEQAARESGAADAERQAPSRAETSAREARPKPLAVQQAKTASRPAPSPPVKASPALMKLWEDGVISTAELERRAREVERLRQRFSAIPSHARRAAADPDYWSKLYDSLVTL